MNTDELGRLMREHDDDVVNPAVARIVSVHQRVIAHRRRVRLASACALVLAVAAALVAPPLFARGSSMPARPAPDVSPAPVTVPTPVPLPLPVSTEVHDGVPVYYQGTRLAASRTGPLATPLTLRFTVPSGSYQVQVSCPGARTAKLRVDASLNGHDLSRHLCGTLLVVDDTNAATYGLSPGKSATFAAQVSGDPGPPVFGGSYPPQPEGTYTLAVRVPVPFDQYKFPAPNLTPPPGGLNALMSILTSLAVPTGTVDPDAAAAGQQRGTAAAGQPLTFRTTWPAACTTTACSHGLAVAVAAATPGQFLVRVNDIPVRLMTLWSCWTFNWFDVDPAQFPTGTLPSAGAPVSVTIEPYDMTGGWGAEVGGPSRPAYSFS